jgi:uncharacterized Zn-binding protein involved in type VI secretion
MPRACLGIRDDAGGGQLLPGRQTSVRCDGEYLIVVTDFVGSHGTHTGTITVDAGSPTTRIEGVAVARTGDPASCGHTCNGTASLTVD